MCMPTRAGWARLCWERRSPFFLMPMPQHPSTKAATLSVHTCAWQVFWIFLRLGLTSFGGPVAHLGYFRDEFVQRRQWLTERSYADLVALCPVFLQPGGSQVGMALGLMRAGMPGALAARLGFAAFGAGAGFVGAGPGGRVCGVRRA